MDISPEIQTHTQPSEFGKKTNNKKMLSYMKMMMAKHKTMMAKICCHVLGLWRQNLIGLLTKLSCVSLLRSKEDVWEGNMLFIPFLKIKMHDVMNVLWKAVFWIEM